MLKNDIISMHYERGARPARDGGFSHKADVPTAAQNVRFWLHRPMLQT
jgi:hypothetical protein